MRSMIIEAVHSRVGGNHGKFQVSVWDYDDFQHISAVDGTRLLAQRYVPHHVQVLDLETGEGVVVLHGGSARNDLMKHRIWVCPLFEHFLQWLYEQPREKVRALNLPDFVELPDAPFAMAGYRRAGARAFYRHRDLRTRGGWLAARIISRERAKAASRSYSGRTTGTWRRTPGRRARTGSGSASRRYWGTR